MVSARQHSNYADAAHPVDEVVGRVLADAGKMMPYLDAVGPQVIARADDGEHE